MKGARGKSRRLGRSLSRQEISYPFVSRKPRLAARASPVESVSPVDLYLLRHELRTPLSGMLGLAEMLAAEDLPGQLALWLATLQACGLQMASLIDRSLRPAVPAGPWDQPSARSINGRGLLEQLLCSHWPAAQAGSVHLYLLIEPEAQTEWKVDPVELRQVLDNLLSNAIRYSRSGHVLLEVSVTPAAMPDREILQLAVENRCFDNADEGRQISRSDLRIADSNAFTQFDYADRSYRMFSRGQGLQLVERFCRKMNGHFRRMNIEAAGTRFELQFPQVLPVQAANFKPFRANLLKRLHCQLLLDQPAERVLASLLTSLDIPVETIDRADEAAVHAMPGSQLLICNPARLPVGLIDHDDILSKYAMWIVFTQENTGHAQLQFQSLAEPLFQAGLQAALLRCLIHRAEGINQVQEAAE
jgi:signal transduction histidine kinase